jgi:hypothetical protein
VHGFIRREDPLSIAGWDQLGIIDVADLTWRFSRSLVTVPKRISETGWHFKQQSI